jgi:glycosyltransferase involved in cell wall biosynthesis
LSQTLASIEHIGSKRKVPLEVVEPRGYALNKPDRLVMLIAPNVSEQMGGEAIKALQIFREFKKLNQNTIQITHERCKAELSGRLNLDGIHYVRDTWLAKFLWRSVVLRQLLDVWFSAKAVKLAEQIAKSQGKANRSTVIHQTEPNSPVQIRRLSKTCFNAIGPINGNIYYPALFRHKETFGHFLRRKLHLPMQRLCALIFGHTRKVDLVLAAGGHRTVQSLLAGGYSRGVLKDTIDCGIRDEFLDQPRIVHTQQNFQFVHYGRLVYHKGTFLAIEALAQADDRVTLDVVGTGPELEACRGLVSRLGLEQRVKFLGWFESHQELLRSLRNYRGMVLPSFEDANGIAVQEAMALGLPPICLNWGGPQLLIEHGKSGFLIDPTSEAEIVSKIADAYRKLSHAPELANEMSIAGKARAEGWRWSRLASEWMSSYPTR